MANEANIKAVITADDRASSVLRGFGDNVGGVANKVGSVLKVAAEGLAIATAGAAAFGVASVKAFEDSQNRIAQTNAVLASTKGVAGVTADAVDKLSKALQRQTTFSDEDVRSVENLLLTFTAINKDIFPQATKTVLNMATALGEDTKSASIQLGKALQDPILGITALRRVGVNFNDAQKEVIKNLVDTGQSAKAQQIILKELETEFGNSAEAARHTFGGSLKALKNQFNDVQEKIGETITKAIQPFIQKAADFLASIDWEAAIRHTINAIRDLKNGIIDFYDSVKNNKVVSEGFLGSIERTTLKIKELVRNIYEIGVQIEQYLRPKVIALWHTFDQDLGPALIKLWKESIYPLIQALGPIVGAGLVWAIGLTIDWINALVLVISKVITWINDHKTAVIALATAFGVLVGAMAIGAAIDAIIVGFATLTLITIPSLIATLGALGGAFLAALPVLAVAVAAAAIVASIMTIKGAWDAVNQAAHAAEGLDNAAVEQQIRDFQKLAAAARATGDTKKVTQYSNAIAALTGGRAEGGPIIAGGAYLVGEKGPEIVVPNHNATVIPNNKIGGSVNITIQTGALMGNDVEARKFAQLIVKHYNDAMGSKMQAGMA